MSTSQMTLATSLFALYLTSQSPSTLLITPFSSSIIQSHDINLHFYADDTQLQDKDKPDNVVPLLTCTADCFDEIKIWMTADKLKLNDDKTEVLALTPSST